MKYRKLVENAKKPNGFWGKMMIKAMNKGHSSLTSWGLEHMNIERTATVLDIGCGGGKTVDFAQLLPTARFTESTIPNSR